MLDFTYQDFGENILTPIVNTSGPTLRADACRYVDFSWFGPRVTMSFSAIAYVDITATAAAKLALIAAQVADSTTGTVLAEIDFPKAGTGGYTGFDVEVTFANPGGTAYLVLASATGVF